MNHFINFQDYADDVGLTKTDFFNPLKKASRSNEKIFFCQLCSRGFTRRDMCIRHERVHTKDFCYFCAICEQGFMRRYVLIKHLKRIHNSDDVTHVLTTKKQRRDGVRNYKTPLSNREQVQPNRDIQFAANPQSSSDLSSTNTNIAVTKFDNASVTGKSIYTKVTLEERIPIVDPEVSNSSPNKILPCKVHELSKEANASHQSYQNILMSGSASILSHQNPSPCAIIKEELAIDISDPNQEITHGNQSCSDKPHLKIDEEANTENFNNRLIIGVSTEDNNQRTNVEVNKEIGQLDIGGNVIELDRNTLEQIKLGNFQVTREEEGNDLRTILIEKPESEEGKMSFFPKFFMKCFSQNHLLFLRDWFFACEKPAKLL